ncbi:MAG: T9SS type A sorting domain-containing protein [Flavobacteriaceae bacterium]|nr:VCBS repeat-containing protein [Bacteroidia bacterium]NNL15486.1 T9SS type A sorting domain-containing protein [Flavobacteriaceae bacterium]
MKRFFLIGITSVLFFNTSAQISFEDQATNLGIGTSCGTTYLGNGVTFHDFDNDGWDDITLTKENGQSFSFYKNVNGSFQESTLNIPAITHQTKQINWVDYDNDGDKDLFITSDTDGNRLFEHTGNFDFQDVTAASGISSANMFSYGSSWGDINNDGYLDLFVSNRTNTIPNKLYKNNGNGTFTDVSVTAGIDQTAVASFCSAFFDLNNDGYQDIYVSNDKPQNPNKLYKNDGDGTFTDISASSGTNIGIDAMTVTIGDFNNDSWFDIYVSNNPDGNVLFKNNGDDTFTDIAQSSGTIFNSVGWGASFFDADNDMDLDLYVCGMFDDSQSTFLTGAFYDNNGNETFTLSNSCFPGDGRASFSSAVGDINNDGLPDMIVTNNDDENIFVWKNKTTTSNNWLKVNLEGTTSNKEGIGSVIEMSANGTSYYRYLICGEGYLSQNSGTEIFGLGSNVIADYVKVTWLSGSVDILYNVNANQVLNIIEGSSPLSIEDKILEEVNIYPNPVANILNIESHELLDIELYDVLGRKQNLKYLDSSKRIDVSFLMNGLYFLQLKKDKEKAIYKIIKQ